MTPKRTDVKPFEYVPANVPFYPPSRQWGVTAPPLKQMQKPLDPAESVKHYVTPVGFELKLFVDESQLGGKPICMNWDERGRLWVAVTVDYPNDKQPEGQGHDRILICEDTDGDGRADKVTVFADRLSIPTSLTFARGGVIVQQAPVTLFLKDTDGDDKADVRQVLFTGWGTRDTHAGPSNLRYGLDNWILGMVGYSGFAGEVGGERFRFVQGFYRFRPDGSKLEFLRSTNNNSWGVGLSEEGVVFGSTANGCPSVYLPIPNRYYEAVRGFSSTVLASIAESNKFYPITDKVRQVDWHGGFTAAAGHALYTARRYPKDYWNRVAFVSDPTGHLTATFVLERSGSDYRSRNAWNLVASDDEWASPVMAEVGPDGNVWVIDWYAYIVQHNPTPPGFKTGKGAAYETELRDKTHGRIYRLVYTGSPAAKPITLKDASPETLVATLANDNQFWRLHAQRLLVERGKLDVVPGLVALINDPSTDAIGLNPGAIHALWTLHGLGALDGTHPEATAAAVRGLRHPSAGVRRNAAQVLPRQTDSARAVLDAALLTDPDPQVKLAALLALADLPESAAAAVAVAAVLEDGGTLQDRWLADAATCAAAAHALPLLKAFAARPTNRPLPGNVAAVLERVAEHYARGGPVDSVGSLLAAMAKAEEPVAAPVLTGLARGWPAGKAPSLGGDTEQALAGWLAKLSPGSRGRLVSLTQRWGSKALEKYAAEVAGAFLVQAGNEKESVASRVAAAGQLIDFRRTDPAAVRQLLELITPQTPPELAQGILDAAGRSEAKEAPAAIVALLPSLTPAVRPAAFRALVGRSDGARALLDAAERGTVRLTELALDQRQALTTQPNRALAARARRLLAAGGGLPDADREKVVRQFLTATAKGGDAEAGKLVFKNQCAKCHTHGGEGAKIGPDLTGMAVHDRAHLLTDILDPSRSVEGNYRQYSVTTKAGRVVTGLLASETRTAVEVLDAEGKRHTFLREEIDEFQASNRSMMPDGFEKLLSEGDLTNLLAFLTQRGKYLPLPLEKAASVVTTRGMFHGEENTVERLVFDDWGPKSVAGVPFALVDPQNGRVPNAVLLYGPQGEVPPRMPKSATVPCNAPAKAVHLLGAVSGWGFPLGERGTTSLIVRLHYQDGATEDHELKNGVHLADYIRRIDVPESRFAFNLRGRQLRYLALTPKRPEVIKEIEFVKGPDNTAPIVMAVTAEPLPANQ
jgi:putative membrane-bound dehydrogenase-like protein